MDDFHERYLAQQPNQVPMSSFPSATATLSTVASAVTTSLRSVASGHGGHGDGGKPRKRHQAAVYYLSRVSWLLFAAIILVLAIHHLIVTRQQKKELKRRIALATTPPKGSRDRIPDSDTPYTDDETDDTSSISSLGKRERRRTNDSSGLGDVESQSNQRGSRWAWWLAQQRNWLYLKTMPKWLYGPETLADGFWTLTYCVILCSFAAYSIIEATEYKLLVFANALGVLAFSQVPMIIILIQKNNPISALTGITYQKLNYLHRASSRACLLFSWIHVVIWFFPLWERTDVNYFLVGWIVWGYVAIFGFTLLWVTSFRLIRRIAFEFFMVSHIVGTLLFVVGGIFHWWRLAYWLWPALAIYAFDRALRFVKLLQINPPRALRFLGSRSAPDQAGQCEITLLDNENMLLVAKRPGLHWTPGQHFYMSVPTVHASPHEGHPFSIANVPNERDELVFLIRVHGGLTKRLRDALKQEVTADIPVYFDGPYGSSHSMAHYSTVILVAGGTGITFLSSHLLGLLAPSVAPTRRHIHLIWHIRHASDTVWLASLLNEAAERLKDFPLTRLTLDVHVTKSGRGNEPSQPFSLTERIAETVAPRRFSRNSPRMDHSELPSAIGSDNGDEVIEDDEDTESVMMDSLRSSRRNSSGANPTEDSRIVRGRDLENGVRERLLSMGMDRRTTDFADLHRLRHGTEQDGQEERETQYLLPPRPSVRFDMTQEGEDDDTFGLTRDAANLLVWKKGRADLVEVLENDLECTDGKVMVTVCGPVQLLHATRKAVKLVSTPERALRGQPQVEFFEETLGS